MKSPSTLSSRALRPLPLSIVLLVSLALGAVVFVRRTGQPETLVTQTPAQAIELPAQKQADPPVEKANPKKATKSAKTSRAGSLSDPVSGKSPNPAPVPPSVLKPQTQDEFEGDVEERKNWFLFQRRFPFDDLPVEGRHKAWDLRPADAPMLSSSINTAGVLEWQPIGPMPTNSFFPTNWGKTSGRINAIAVSPTNPNLVLIGGGTGGVWRSTDAGTTFVPVSDNQVDLAVGSIAFAPSNSSIVYAGMGDKAAHYLGTGVLRSTDAGQTWTRVSNGTLPSLGVISQILVDANDANRVYVAQFAFSQNNSLFASGFYFSTDGGVNWTKTITGTARDLIRHPTQTGTYYLAMGSTDFANGANGGVFKSTNSGQSWSRVYTSPFGTADNIKVAVTPAAPENVYVLVGKASVRLEVSTNGGGTWSNRGSNFDIGQFFYNCYLFVHPTNPNTIFVGTRDLWRSTNGGSTYTNITGNFSIGGNYTPNFAKAHPDQHHFHISTSNPNIIYVANDGGLWKSTDGANSFTSLNSTLALTMFTSYDLHPTDASRSYGGTQDNGTQKRVSAQTWREFSTGDGGETFVDTLDPSIVYATYIAHTVFRFTNNGDSSPTQIGNFGTFNNDRVAFYPPFVGNETNSNIYFGTYRLYVSTNRGASWFTPGGFADLTFGGVLSAIAVAKSNTNVIYTGASDGRLMVSTNGGVSWIDRTFGLPQRFIKSITVSPTDANTAYVTVSGFGSGHVFKTTNAGSSWTNISGNLPDIPTNDLLIDPRPGNSNTLYVGTDIGVFRSTAGGTTWETFNSGLPPTIISEIDAQPNGVMHVGTYGRGAFEIDLNQGAGGCTYSLNPTSQSFGSAGGSGSFTVTTGVGCAWSAVSNSTWITTNSIGSGNGTVNFNVASNSSAARSGNITVAGQIFSINQSAGGGGCPSTAISPGQTINGTLTTSDCFFTGTTRWVDVYNFNGVAGQQIAITMNSTTFDTYLFLLNSSNQTIAEDDDGGPDTNSRIPVSGFFTLPSTGNFTIFATSFSADGVSGSTGAYSIALSNASCNYALNPTSQSFGSAGGSSSFAVTTATGCAWSAVSNATWITTTSSGSGNGNVIYSVASNSGAARTGTITVNGQTFTVNQNGAGGGCPGTPISVGQSINGTITTSDCFFVGTTRHVDVYTFSGTAGQQIAITMNSGTFDTYLYLLSPSNQTITQDDDGGGGLNSRIPANAGFFTLPSTGTYTIHATSFSFDGITGSTGSYTISLTGVTSCTFSLNSTGQSFGSGGGSGSFGVLTSAGCIWSAVSNAGWITTNSSGSGNGTVNYSVLGNSGAARTGTITVNGRTFTITQSAGGGGCPSTTISAGQIINGSLTTSDCVFSGTTRRVDVYNFSGTAGQQIAISMNSGTFDTYLYLVNSSNQTLTEDDDGGDGLNSRIPFISGFFTLPSTGTFTILATSYSFDGLTGSTGSYSLNLLGASCSYSLSPTSQSFGSGGGSGSFGVTTAAGCAWSAVSNATWITTTSSGSGNGTISYNVASNSGAARTGTITVNGQLFTVSQSGAVSNTIQFSGTSFSAGEAAGHAQVIVTRSGSTSSAATVNFATSDIAGLQNCTLANGRGSERCDYVTSLGTLRFAAGETSKTIFIPIINDVLMEGNETFTITLSGPSGASLGSPATATITILENDFSTPTSNPIDGVEFFIRQQYLDILNRQPDSTGLQNWINTLAPCPNGGFGEPPTSTCDRLHVAAGFFQSDEFLNRGYWAFRFYMVSHNQRPTYAQFIPDMAQVGGPKSPAEEETSKVAFANAFVQRPAFLTRYPGLSGQALANALLQTAGLPSNTFTVTPGMTNGQILRGIVETTAVANRFLTDGTVSIQYFGFLRRDPDTIGYQNNVNTLNASPNNLRHMIFIFIYSTEYRSRFGP